MGVVYEAHDHVIDRRVAIKLVRSELLAGQERDDYMERFRREAQAAARCSHPGVVVVFDYATHEGNPYLVMEYVDGVGLDKVLAQGERFAPPAAVHVMNQVLDALGAAHAAGIVHRDIKPANILLLAGARVKVTDFGVARMVSSNLTHDGIAIGTPSYMSPEQWRGEPTDARSDLFSTATVLQEMLIGRLPFRGRALTEMAVRLLHEPPEGGPEVEALSGPALRAVFTRALSKRPEDRFASAAEMAEALRQAIGDTGPEASLAETVDRTVVAVRARAPSRQSVTAATNIDPNLISTIERRLAERLGPIARYLVQTTLRTSASAEELCDTLAQHIDRSDERRLFLTETMEAVRIRSGPNVGGRSARPGSASHNMSPPSQLPSGRTPPSIQPEEVERARHALAESQGPIARILVQRALAKASSSGELWDMLAEEIRPLADRIAFLRHRDKR